MKKFMLILMAISCLFTSCDDRVIFPGHGKHSPTAKKYSAEVATTWIDLQQHLTKTTSGFDPLVAARAFAYSGLTLYESIVVGMPGYTSVVSPRLGENLDRLYKHPDIHWPASANAAMAFILKNLYANTSEDNKDAIDSLEQVFNTLFLQTISPASLEHSSALGQQIANKIFEWSKTDGGHEAYLAATNNSYEPPVGPGKWVPTPPNFTLPIRPYWGNNRSFVANSATATLPPPPPAYSEQAASDFYSAVDEVYQASLTLTAEEISMVKTWGDLPGNYGTSSHYTHIATQLIRKNQLMLDAAAVTYAKHGMAIYEATISVFKAKYVYNLIRPVSYIRNVLGHDTWTTVIGTPPHPEFPSAHATIGGASYVILESIFGKNHAFTDRTHENLFGARSYNNLKAYAEEAAYSRFLGGIHYKFSATVGLEQGEKVGKLINQIKFKGQPNEY